MQEKVGVYGRFELPDVSHVAGAIVIRHRPIIPLSPAKKRNLDFPWPSLRAVGILSIARAGIPVI